jgi:hypothetical protein
LPAASKVNDEGDSESADFAYCVTGMVAVAPSEAVTVMVEVRWAPVLADTVAVIVLPDMDTVSHVSPDGRDTDAVTPVESPVIVVVAIFFKFFKLFNLNLNCLLLIFNCLRRQMLI